MRAYAQQVGSQDQILTAYGGFNHITFAPSGESNVQPMILPPERFASRAEFKELEDFSVHEA